MNESKMRNPKRLYANPEDSNVYRNVNVNETYDPGWGRTFVDQIDFYKHLIPSGIGKALKLNILKANRATYLSRRTLEFAFQNP